MRTFVKIMLVAFIVTCWFWNRYTNPDKVVYEKKRKIFVFALFAEFILLIAGWVIALIWSE